MQLIKIRSLKFKNKLHAFLISNARLKLAKNQANAKQHPEAEHLLFENHSLSSLRHHPEIMGDILTKSTKNKCDCLD